MEEKKTKTVEMTPKENQPENKSNNQKHSKEELDLMMELDSMSKEKLKELCGQLYYQNNKLMDRIKSMDMTNIFKRLDYLFKIVEHPEVFPKEFVDKVVIEICEGMYPSSESQG